MITSFSNKTIEDFFYNGVRKNINPGHAKKLMRILDRLDGASSLKDMRYPGSSLHKLEPKDAEIYSVKVSKNWRVVFRFTGGNAYDVDYKDYH